MTPAERRAALVALLPDEIDGVLVTKLVNVRYLTGFTGSNGALLVTREAAVLATDGRYATQAEAEAADVVVRVTRGPAAELAAEAAGRQVRSLGVEHHHVTLAVAAGLREAAPDLAVVDAGRLVERLRARKDAAELQLLHQACAATDAALASVIETVRTGDTEREVAWRLLVAMREAGADGAAFESIVAFGPHSAVPHHRPTDRALARGDLVKLDFGAAVGGYHADMTRTLVCGPAADWQRDLHAEVLRIQRRCLAGVVAGAVPSDLHDLACHLVADTGHELVHGLGHGVGLEIHEEPFATPGSASAALEVDTPITVEPGIYLPGRGGVRIEDTVQVTTGQAASLTRSPSELVEV